MTLPPEIIAALQTADLDQSLRAVNALVKALTSSLLPQEAVGFYSDSQATRELCQRLFEYIARYSGTTLPELTDAERSQWIAALDEVLAGRTMGASHFQAGRATASLDALRAVVVPVV